VSDLRTDVPALTRDLAAVVRFLDAFTGEPVRTPLGVRIPALNWAAFWWDADATYRFSLANASLVAGVPQFPIGIFDLEVTEQGYPISTTSAEGKLPHWTYAALEACQVTLPPTPHSPPLVTDYRVDLPLWPTVAFRPPARETALVGSVVSASSQDVTGLKVILLDASIPPPANPPYTRTDRSGQFLFRLPALRRGAASNPTATLNVQLFDVANTQLAVTPAILTVPIGVVTNFIKLNLP
jgi:hypothetical protein